MTRFVHQQRAADGGRVALLEVDPELASGLPEDERERAERALVVQSLIVQPGPWDGIPSSAFALLVAEGLVVRETAVGGRLLPQVLGAGDVLESWPEPEGVLGAEVGTT